MKKLTVATLIILSFILSPETILSQGKVKDLPSQYKKWLTEDVIYIITAKEKEVFLQLESNRERDLFIEAFWKQRDPTPGSPQNEFKDEHYERIIYANKMFRSRSSKPGWKTERGRIQIILGKPITSESYGALDHNLVPIEVWFYQGDYGFGMPTGFYVVFFKEWGLGDYILYSPTRHGPRKLLESYDVDSRKAASVLASVNPELLKISRSLIPGRQSIEETSSALSSEILLNKIAVLPQRKIQDQYAEKLLKYKTFIEVDHSVSYVDNDALIKVMKNEQGFFFVHYAIEPRKLSIGRHENNYYANLEIYGKISDPEGKTIYQFEKKVSLNFDQEQLEEMKTKLFSYQDVFPLIPGNFKFDLLIKNTVSKEFSSVEQDITIPQSSTNPQMSPLLLTNRTRKILSEDNVYNPFQFGNTQFFPYAKRSYTTKDRLNIFFKLYELGTELKEYGYIDFSFFKEDEKVHSFQEKIANARSSNGFLKSISLADFSPGIYTLKVRIIDKNQKEIITEREDFQISPAGSIPRYWSVSEIRPLPEDPVHAYILGQQMMNTGEVERAIALLEMAYQKRPASLEFGMGLARAYYYAKDYRKAQGILTRFLENAKDEQQIYHMLGKSHHKLGKFGQAIYYYKKYLSQFGTHLEILNSLGEAYQQTGEIEEALRVWEESLKINPNQADVKEKIAEHKNNKTS